MAHYYLVVHFFHIGLRDFFVFSEKKIAFNLQKMKNTFYPAQIFFPFFQGFFYSVFKIICYILSKNVSYLNNSFTISKVLLAT